MIFLDDFVLKVILFFLILHMPIRPLSKGGGEKRRFRKKKKDTKRRQKKEMPHFPESTRVDRQTVVVVVILVWLRYRKNGRAQDV